MKNKIILPIFLILLITASARAATFVVNSTVDAADANLTDNLCETATAGECALRAIIEQTKLTFSPPRTNAMNFPRAPFLSAQI